MARSKRRCTKPPRATTQVFAVTGIPDDRKGEQLAVLHTIDEARIPDILGKLAANGLPNLFMPPREQFRQSRRPAGTRDWQNGPASLKRIAIERLSLKPELRGSSTRELTDG